MENSELITRALSYIRSESRKSDIGIEDVAAHAGFSKDYFNRIFFAHTGFSVLPIDDVQVSNAPMENKSGVFFSADLGYQAVIDACILK